jgi:hypothetical protein
MHFDRNNILIVYIIAINLSFPRQLHYCNNGHFLSIIAVMQK